jgi:hypothetical protein
MFLESEDVGPEVVDLSLFLDFVNRMQQILIQGSTRIFLGRRTIMTCASMRMVINSQSFVDDSALFILAMVEEAHHLFKCTSRRP